MATEESLAFKLSLVNQLYDEGYISFKARGRPSKYVVDKLYRMYFQPRVVLMDICKLLPKSKTNKKELSDKTFALHEIQVYKNSDCTQDGYELQSFEPLEMKSLSRSFALVDREELSSNDGASTVDLDPESKQMEYYVDDWDDYFEQESTLEIDESYMANLRIINSPGTETSREQDTATEVKQLCLESNIEIKDFYEHSVCEENVDQDTIHMAMEENEEEIFYSHENPFGETPEDYANINQEEQKQKLNSNPKNIDSRKRNPRRKRYIKLKNFRVNKVRRDRYRLGLVKRSIKLLVPRKRKRQLGTLKLFPRKQQNGTQVKHASTARHRKQYPSRWFINVTGIKDSTGWKSSSLDGRKQSKPILQSKRIPQSQPILQPEAAKDDTEDQLENSTDGNASPNQINKIKAPDGNDKGSRISPTAEELPKESSERLRLEFTNHNWLLMKYKMEDEDPADDSSIPSTSRRQKAIDKQTKPADSTTLESKQSHILESPVAPINGSKTVPVHQSDSQSTTPQRPIVTGDKNNSNSPPCEAINLVIKPLKAPEIKSPISTPLKPIRPKPVPDTIMATGNQMLIATPQNMNQPKAIPENMTKPSPTATGTLQQPAEGGLIKAGAPVLLKNMEDAARSLLLISPVTLAQNQQGSPMTSGGPQITNRSPDQNTQLSVQTKPFVPQNKLGNSTQRKQELPQNKPIFPQNMQRNNTQNRQHYNMLQNPSRIKQCFSQIRPVAPNTMLQKQRPFLQGRMAVTSPRHRRPVKRLAGPAGNQNRMTSMTRFAKPVVNKAIGEPNHPYESLKAASQFYRQTVAPVTQRPPSHSNMAPFGKNKVVPMKKNVPVSSAKNSEFNGKSSESNVRSLETCENVKEMLKYQIEHCLKKNAPVTSPRSSAAAPQSTPDSTMLNLSDPKWRKPSGTQDKNLANARSTQRHVTIVIPSDDETEESESDHWMPENSPEINNLQQEYRTIKQMILELESIEKTHREEEQLLRARKLETSKRMRSLKMRCQNLLHTGLNATDKRQDIEKKSSYVEQPRSASKYIQPVKKTLAKPARGRRGQMQPPMPQQEAHLKANRAKFYISCAPPAAHQLSPINYNALSDMVCVFNDKSTPAKGGMAEDGFGSEPTVPVYELRSRPTRNDTSSIQQSNVRSPLNLTTQVSGEGDRDSVESATEVSAQTSTEDAQTEPSNVAGCQESSANANSKVAGGTESPRELLTVSINTVKQSSTLNRDESPCKSDSSDSVDSSLSLTVPLKKRKLMNNAAENGDKSHTSAPLETAVQSTITEKSSQPEQSVVMTTADGVTLDPPSSTPQEERSEESISTIVLDKEASRNNKNSSDVAKLDTTDTAEQREPDVTPPVTPREGAEQKDSCVAPNQDKPATTVQQNLNVSTSRSGVEPSNCIPVSGATRKEHISLQNSPTIATLLQSDLHMIRRPPNAPNNPVRHSASAQANVRSSPRMNKSNASTKAKSVAQTFSPNHYMPQMPRPAFRQQNPVAKVPPTIHHQGAAFPQVYRQRFQHPMQPAPVEYPAHQPPTTPPSYNLHMQTSQNQYRQKLQKRNFPAPFLNAQPSYIRHQSFQAIQAQQMPGFRNEPLNAQGSARYCLEQLARTGPKRMDQATLNSQTNQSAAFQQPIQPQRNAPMAAVQCESYDYDGPPGLCKIADESPSPPKRPQNHITYSRKPNYYIQEKCLPKENFVGHSRMPLDKMMTRECLSTGTKQSGIPSDTFNQQYTDRDTYETGCSLQHNTNFYPCNQMAVNHSHSPHMLGHTKPSPPITLDTCSASPTNHSPFHPDGQDRQLSHVNSCVGSNHSVDNMNISLTYENTWSPEKLLKLACANALCTTPVKFLCSSCRKVAYCSIQCQKATWREHSRMCRK